MAKNDYYKKPQGDQRLMEDLTINLSEKVSPQKLAAIFGCNVSLIYQDAQAGKLPDLKNGDFTYLECIQHSRRYLIKNEGVKLAKIELEASTKEAKIAADLRYKESQLRAKEALEEKAREAKKSGNFSEEVLSPLMSAKVKQEIRLSVAREQQVWIRSQAERGAYYSAEEMLMLCEPILDTVKQILLKLASTSEAAEKPVDEAIAEFHQLGQTLIEQSKVDEERFITAIMNREVDYTEIDIDSATSPLL